MKKFIAGVYSLIVIGYFIYFLGYIILGMNTGTVSVTETETGKEISYSSSGKQFVPPIGDIRLEKGKYLLGGDLSIGTTRYKERERRSLENQFEKLKKCSYTIKDSQGNKVDMLKEDNKTSFNGIYILGSFEVQKSGDYQMEYPSDSIEGEPCAQTLEVIEDGRKTYFKKALILVLLMLGGFPLARRRT